jgi:hypothetical protein
MGESLLGFLFLKIFLQEFVHLTLNMLLSLAVARALGTTTVEVVVLAVTALVFLVSPLVGVLLLNHH